MSNALFDKFAEPMARPSEKQPPKKISPSKRKSDCEKLFQILRDTEGGVSSLLLREIFPSGLTQRISDLRKQGHKIKCYSQPGTSCSLYELIEE